MKKILIVLFGVLVFQGSVWAYGGEDAKCDAGDPYTQECYAQGLSACWDMTAHPSYPAQSNPWVVGEAVLQNDKMKDCRQVCAINDTCWQEKWVVAGNQPLAGDLSCVVAGNQIKLHMLLFADWNAANYRIGKAACK